MNGEFRLSEHPTDRLIRDLIRTDRAAEQDEVQRIQDRMASAPFDPRRIRPLPPERDLQYEGRTVGPRDEALFVHVIRRVVRNRQWALGTTGERYLDDLRRSIRSPKARLALYWPRGGNIAATLSPTDDTVPTMRRGAEFLSSLWVVYSADRGIIVTGYQVASIEEVSIPKDTQWLQ